MRPRSCCCASGRRQPTGAKRTVRVVRPTIYFFGCDQSTLDSGLSILLKAPVLAAQATELDLLASQPHDLVIAPLDRMEAMRESGESIPAQWVVVSPSPQEHLERARAAGAKGLLALPFDPHRLLQMAQKLTDAANRG